MALTSDQDKIESRALDDIVDFHGQNVLEVGCGDGRLTWLYADKPRHIMAIDPDAEQIALAKVNLPNQLRSRIEFQAIPFEDFASKSKPSLFDIVLLSYSLC